jgi:hypothetical protein
METSLVQNCEVPEWDAEVLKVIGWYQRGFGGGGLDAWAGILYNGQVYRRIRCTGMREFFGLPNDLQDLGFVELLGENEIRDGYKFLFEEGAEGIGKIPEVPEEEW